MSTCTQATSSAVSTRYIPASAPNVTTSHSAGCTSRRVVTTTVADPSTSTPSRPSTTSTAVTVLASCPRLPGSSVGLVFLGLLGLRRGLGGVLDLLRRGRGVVVRGWRRHRPHPLAETFPLVGEV